MILKTPAQTNKQTKKKTNKQKRITNKKKTQQNKQTKDNKKIPNTCIYTPPPFITSK